MARSVATRRSSTIPALRSLSACGVVSKLGCERSSSTLAPVGCVESALEASSQASGPTCPPAGNTPLLLVSHSKTGRKSSVGDGKAAPQAPEELRAPSLPWQRLCELSSVRPYLAAPLPAGSWRLAGSSPRDSWLANSRPEAAWLNRWIEGVSAETARSSAATLT